jgi:tungstate transport system ATP-binding protein
VDPELLFLDEPFATLDAPSRRRLAGELRTILEERQIATLFVTHDLAEARQLSRRGLILDEGRLLQEGDLAEMMAQPSSKRVAEILGLA